MTTAPTHVAAGLAITSPWWLPPLTAVSQLSAVILPILGAAWLIVQITAKLIEVYHNRKNRG